MNTLTSYLWSSGNSGVTKPQSVLESAQARKTSLGSALLGRVRQLQAAAEMACNAAEHTKKHGTRAVAAAATGAVAGQQLFEGNLMTAAGLGVVSVKELMTVYNEIMSSPSKLENLLDDVKGSLTAIDGLAESQAQSLKAIGADLKGVERGLRQIDSYHERIANISDNAGEIVNNHKKQLEKLLAKNKKFQVEAGEYYQAAQSKIGEAGKYFDQVNEFLREAVGFASKEQSEENAKKFAEAANAALTACEQGQARLLEAGKDIEAGNNKSKYASNSSEAVKTQLSILIKELNKNNGDLKHELGLAKAESKDAQEAAKKMKAELTKMQTRNEAIRKLAEEAQQDVEEAKQVAGKKESMIKTLVAGGLGALIGAFFFGPVGAAITVILVMIASQHSDKAISLLSGLFPKNTDPKALEAGKSDFIEVTYKDEGDSAWERLRNKHSTTQGKAKVKVGNGRTVEANVDLSREYAIGKQDLLNIAKRLEQDIKDGFIAKEQALKTLNELATIKVGERIGLVPAKSPFFTELLQFIQKFSAPKASFAVSCAA